MVPKKGTYKNKIDAKLRRYRILFKDMHTFLRLDYRDASFKILEFKWTYALSGNDYRIATLSKSYIMITEIII